MAYHTYPALPPRSVVGLQIIEGSQGKRAPYNAISPTAEFAYNEMFGTASTPRGGGGGGGGGMPDQNGARMIPSRRQSNYSQSQLPRQPIHSSSRQLPRQPSHERLPPDPDPAVARAITQVRSLENELDRAKHYLAAVEQHKQAALHWESASRQGTHGAGVYQPAEAHCDISHKKMTTAAAAAYNSDIFNQVPQDHLRHASKKQFPSNVNNPFNPKETSAAKRRSPRVGPGHKSQLRMGENGFTSIEEERDVPRNTERPFYRAAQSNISRAYLSDDSRASPRRLQQQRGRKVFNSRSTDSSVHFGDDGGGSYYPLHKSFRAPTGRTSQLRRAASRANSYASY